MIRMYVCKKNAVHHYNTHVYIYHPNLAGKMRFLLATPVPVVRNSTAEVAAEELTTSYY